MDLYRKCVLVIMKNPHIQIDQLPKRMQHEILPMIVAYQKMTEWCPAYDMYFKKCAETGEVAWDTLRCEDCGHHLPLLDPRQWCDFHSLLLGYLCQETREIKEKMNPEAKAAAYSSARGYVKSNVPQFLDILEKLEENCDGMEEITT